MHCRPGGFASALPIFRRIGTGLPVVMGISFAYVPTLQSIGADFGLGAILLGIVTVVAILLNFILPKDSEQECKN